MRPEKGYWGRTIIWRLNLVFRRPFLDVHLHIELQVGRPCDDKLRRVRLRLRLRLWLWLRLRLRMGLGLRARARN